MTAERDTVVETLTDAFYDDPLMVWIFGDAERRIAQLTDFWAFNVDQNPPTGRILSTDGGEAAAIWRAPVHAPPADEGTSPFVELMVELLGEDVAWAKMAAMAEFGERHPATPHWYLPAVGTRVGAQGRGFGPRVIVPILELCDSGGLPAYLESSNPRNVPFYARLGFAPMSTLEVGGAGGPLVTFMWREPRTIA